MDENATHTKRILALYKILTAIRLVRSLLHFRLLFYDEYMTHETHTHHCEIHKHFKLFINYYLHLIINYY